MSHIELRLLFVSCSASWRAFYADTGSIADTAIYQAAIRAGPPAWLGKRQAKSPPGASEIALIADESDVGLVRT
jgi:hypothetical protein